MYARGSSYKRYVQQLVEQCTRLWQDGRQLCEAISLTGNPCKNEVRIFSTEIFIDDHL
jgi:protein SMG8